MLNYIRKHQRWILILTTIIIIIAFSVWGNNPHGSDRAAIAGVEMNGKFRSLELVQRDGDIAGLSRQLAGNPYFGGTSREFSLLGNLISQTNTALFPDSDPAKNGRPESEDEFKILQAVNYHVLKENMAELGLEVSDKKLTSFIESVPTLQTPGALEFLKERNSQRGISEADLVGLFRVAANAGLLSDLCAANLVPSPLELEMAQRLQRAGFTGFVLRFENKDFLAPAEVTDAEIAARYEETKANLNSEEKRAIQFVFFQAPFVPDTATEEEKLTSRKTFLDNVDKFYSSLSQGKTPIAELASAAKLEVRKTEPFTRSATPTELSLIEGASNIPAEVFLVDPAIKVGNPVETAKGFVVFEVISVEEPRSLTLEEAKDNIRQEIAGEKAAEAALKAATTAREKGVEAAKKGLEELQKMATEWKAKIVPADKIMLSGQNPELPDLFSLRGDILKAEPNSFSAPATTGDAVLVAWVKEKHVFKDPLAADNRGGAIRYMQGMFSEVALRHWFTSQMRDSKVAWRR